MCSKLKISTAWHISSVFIADFEHSQHINMAFLLLTLNKYLLVGCERRVIMFWKHKNRYICFVKKAERPISFSDLSLHRIEISSEQMTMLWTYYEHNMNICFSSKRIIIVSLIFFCCIKLKTVKQIGRYLIYYDDNRAKYLQIFMRQRVKPAWIGHTLKRRPEWERQTRLIPSVFYMLSFYAFLKRKP